MAGFLSVQRQIAAEQKKIRILLLHILNKSIQNFPAVEKNASVSSVHIVDEALAPAARQILSQIVDIRGQHNLIERLLACLCLGFLLCGFLQALPCLRRFFFAFLCLSACVLALRRFCLCL